MIKKVLGIKYNWRILDNKEECNLLMVGDAVYDEVEKDLTHIDHIEIMEDPQFIAHIYLATGRYYVQTNINQAFIEEK